MNAKSKSDSNPELESRTDLGRLDATSDEHIANAVASDPDAAPLLSDEMAARAVVRRGRGPQKLPTKIPKYIRFSPDVLEYFESTGKGWQTRMDKALQEWISEQG